MAEWFTDLGLVALLAHLTHTHNNHINCYSLSTVHCIKQKSCIQYQKLNYFSHI